MTLNIKKYDQFLPLTLRLKKFAVKQDLVNSNVLNLNMGIWKACVSATIDCFFFPDIRDLKCDVHHLNDVYYPFVTWRRSTKFALTMSRTFYLYQRGGFGEKTRTNSEIMFIQNTAIRFNGRTMDGPVITLNLIHYFRWRQYRRLVGILKDRFQLLLLQQPTLRCHCFLALRDSQTLTECLPPIGPRREWGRWQGQARPTRSSEESRK